MTHTRPPGWAVHALIFAVGFIAIGGEGTSDEQETFSMSPAVACRAIEGYEDFELLPDAALTCDEKLLVYYCPTGFQSEPVGDKFRAHFVQDARIRRRGERTVLRSKKKLLDFEVKSDFPPVLVYLRNSISLKGLKPGQYELDIILHDKVGGGAPANQVLTFRVVAAAPAPVSPTSDGSGAR